MKKNDLLVWICTLAILLPFFVSSTVYQAYNQFNSSHGIVMSFLKFAFLATFGESIALRIKTGQYNQKGFGLVPRAIVWGFLGITIKMAFVVFSTGTLSFLQYLGLQNTGLRAEGITLMKLFTAFSISTALNLIYAPMMMTMHKITDFHILEHHGSLKGFLHPLDMGGIMSRIDWHRQWNFVFRKTIPLFWIPAHTITFLLPSEFQVLFAALLSVALGILLSFSSRKPHHAENQTVK